MPRQILAAVADWPVLSQQRARRNALLASTALTDRRRERLEVEDFLDQHLGRRPREVREPREPRREAHTA